MAPDHWREFVRRVVVICTFVLLMAPSGGHSQPQKQNLPSSNDASKDSTDTKMEVEKLRSQIIQLESKISNAELTHKLETERLKSEITNEKKEISSAEINMGGQYFIIFGTLLTLLAVASGLIGLLIKERITRQVLEKTEGEVRDQISRIIKIESQITIAEMYAYLIEPWWQIYGGLSRCPRLVYM
jgi:hypothetical protein